MTSLACDSNLLNDLGLRVSCIPFSFEPFNDFCEVRSASIEVALELLATGLQQLLDSIWTSSHYLSVGSRGELINFRFILFIGQRKLATALEDGPR